MCDLVTRKFLSRIWCKMKYTDEMLNKRHLTVEVFHIAMFTKRDSKALVTATCHFIRMVLFN